MTTITELESETDLITVKHPELISDFTSSEMKTLNERTLKVIRNIRRFRNIRKVIENDNRN